MKNIESREDEHVKLTPIACTALHNAPGQSFTLIIAITSSDLSCSSSVYDTLHISLYYNTLLRHLWDLQTQLSTHFSNISSLLLCTCNVYS